MKPLHVLVAEDNYMIADDIATTLEQAGAIVVGPAPDLKRAFGRLAVPNGLGLAILDIRLGRELVFPLADALMNEGVPFIFFSGYDDLIIPERFSRVVRVSKSKGINELMNVVREQHYRDASSSDLIGDFAFGVVDLLPELRWRARRLVADRAAADGLVEKVLETALTEIERGIWHGSTRRNLNRLLTDIHLCRQRLN